MGRYYFKSNYVYFGGKNNQCYQWVVAHKPLTLELQPSKWTMNVVIITRFFFVWTWQLPQPPEANWGLKFQLILFDAGFSRYCPWQGVTLKITKLNFRKQIWSLMWVQSSNAIKVFGRPISNRVDGRSLLWGPTRYEDFRWKGWITYFSL